MKSSINENDFLLILQICEDKCEILYDLNNNHPLHQFSDRFVSANQYQGLYIKIVNHFLYGDIVSSQEQPTFHQVMTAYGHFCLALDTAICFEKAKNCSLPAQKSPA